jgi:hypothetical protein
VGDTSVILAVLATYAVVQLQALGADSSAELVIWKLGVRVYAPWALATLGGFVRGACYAPSESIVCASNH